MPATPTLAAAHAAADTRSRRRINESLGGPVMAILRQLVPDLAVLPRGREFEMVLADWHSLDLCFKAFRGHRDAFRSVLLDRQLQPVDNDNTPLECGRTLNQVVAMIVRSAAKRHFRQRLNPPQPWTGRPGSRFDTPEGLGWSGMLQWMVGRAEAHRLAAARPQEKSPADRLYSAIHRYLLHDWQVPIIPQYARMTPPEVQALGSRILDFRSAGQLAAWLDGSGDEREMPSEWVVEVEPVAPAPEPKLPEVMPLPEPLPEPVIGGASLPGAPLVDRRSRLGDVLSADGRLIRMDTMMPILIRPEIRECLGRPSLERMRAAGRALATTGGGTVRRLAVDFGLSPECMAVMLTQAALLLPPAVFERLFGRRGELLLILALIQRARHAGLGPDSPPDAFAAFMAGLFGRFAR